MHRRSAKAIPGRITSQAMLLYDMAAQQACVQSDAPDTLCVFPQAITSGHLAKVLGRVMAWSAQSRQVTSSAGLMLLQAHVSLISKPALPSAPMSRLLAHAHPAGELQSASAGSDASTGSVDSAPAPQQGALHSLDHQASTESSTGSGGVAPPPASERPRHSPPRPQQNDSHAGRLDPDGPPCTSPVRRQPAHSRWLHGQGSKGWPCSTPQPQQTRRHSDLMLCRPDADSSVSPLRFSRRLAAKHTGPGLACSSPAGASSLADFSEPGRTPSEQHPGRVSSPAGRATLGAYVSSGRTITLADRPRLARGSAGGSRGIARGLRATARGNSRHGDPEEEQQEQPAAGSRPSGLRKGGSSAVAAVQASAVLAAAVEESEARESPRQRPRGSTEKAQAVPATGAAGPELQEGVRKRTRWGEQSSLVARSLAEQLGGPHKRPCCSRQSLPGSLPLVQSLPPERSSPGANSSGGSGKRQRSAACPHSGGSTRQRQVGLLHAAGSALPVAARELQQLPRADAGHLCSDDPPIDGSKCQERRGGQPTAGSAALQGPTPAAGSKPQRKLADLATAGSSTLQGPGREPQQGPCREPQQGPADLPTAASSTCRGGTPIAAGIPQPQAPMSRLLGPPSSSSLPGLRPPLVTRTSQPNRSLTPRLKSSSQLHALPAQAGGAHSRAASPEAADGCGTWQWEHCAGSNSPEPGHGASRQQQEATAAAERRRAAAAAAVASAEEKRAAEAAALVAEQRRAAAAQAQQQREGEDRFTEALNQVGLAQAQQQGSCLRGAASGLSCTLLPALLPALCSFLDGERYAVCPAPAQQPFTAERPNLTTCGEPT